MKGDYHLVFINRSFPPSVLSRDGKFQDMDPVFPSAESVLSRFDNGSF